MIVTLTQSTERRLESAKGKVVVTTLSDTEALQAIAEVPSSFAQDLYSKSKTKPLSHDQMVWVHVLAMEAAAPKAEAVNIGEFARIYSLFGLAQESLKRPKICLKTEDGGDVALSVAGPKSRTPGDIHVASSRSFGQGVYYGRIDKEGKFHGRGNAPEGVIALLQDFAADPEGTAARYGQLTGSCCFCARELTDERSTAVGYGPKCAKNYGLDWG